MKNGTRMGIAILKSVVFTVGILIPGKTALYWNEDPDECWEYSRKLSWKFDVYLHVFFIVIVEVNWWL